MIDDVRFKQELESNINILSFLRMVETAVEILDEGNVPESIKPCFSLSLTGIK
jgi:hypothetical protein